MVSVMRVGVLVIEVFIHGAESLKDRRRVVRSLKDRCRRKFNVSVAEVGDTELHQRAEIAFATVAQTHDRVHQVFEKLLNDAESAGERVHELSREVF